MNTTENPTTYGVQITRYGSMTTDRIAVKALEVDPVIFPNWMYSLYNSYHGEDAATANFERRAFLEKRLDKAFHKTLESAVDYIMGIPNSTTQQKVDAISTVNTVFKRLNALQEFEEFQSEKIKEIENKEKELGLEEFKTEKYREIENKRFALGI